MRTDSVWIIESVSLTIEEPLRVLCFFAGSRLRRTSTKYVHLRLRLDTLDLPLVCLLGGWNGANMPWKDVHSRGVSGSLIELSASLLRRGSPNCMVKPQINLGATHDQKAGSRFADRCAEEEMGSQGRQR